jgi:hypothetical protein
MAKQFWEKVMSKYFLIFAIIILAWSAAGAVSDPGYVGDIPIVTDQGGPDAFGYRWIDNDSAGGPTYNWIDITGFGTQVAGLADDNSVGTFALGFQFPYYWYTVERVWIGSNGYVTFSGNQPNFAHPFASIPNNLAPNDLVAVLAGDLDFTVGGTCYYYTNAVDTFIVSWIDVPQFSSDGSQDDSTHTFQLILSAADSSLTFQYGENHGNFNEAGNLQTVIGMENVNGQVGLEYLEDNLPSQRMWHDGLATRYYPIPDPNFVVHDFGVVNGLQEGSGAMFVHEDSSFQVRLRVKNFGNQPEPTLRASCIIRRGTTFVVYHDTVDVPALAPGEEYWVDFPDLYTPDSVFQFRAIFATIMTGDQNSTNNTITCEIDCYNLPQYLSYVDNTADNNRSWNGDFSGFGVEYQVPEPVRVDSATFYIAGFTANGPAYVWIVPDDGTGPDMDNILAGDTIDITIVGWYTMDVTPFNLNFGANAKFYVVALHAFVSTFAFGVDTAIPLSRRGWEYTGGLAPDRDRDVSDVMFKVWAEVGVEPEPGTIAGTVTDGTNPLVDVLVTTYNSQDEVVGVDTSAVDGTYSLDVMAGIYRETFEKAGYDDLEITGIVVLSGQTTDVDPVMVESGGCAYIPGDINGNGQANGIDVTYGVGYFKGGPPPPIDCGTPVGPCPQGSPFFAAGDVNGNCAFNGIDVTFYVSYLKGGQPALLYCLTCPPAR